MTLVRVFNEATGQYADVPAKSYGSWAARGWTTVESDSPEVVTVSAAEADETTSRGKPSARAQKDK